MHVTYVIRKFQADIVCSAVYNSRLSVLLLGVEIFGAVPEVKIHLKFKTDIDCRSVH